MNNPEENLTDMLKKIVVAIQKTTNGQIEKSHFGKLEVTAHIESGATTAVTVAGRRFRKEDLISGP